MCLSKNIRFWIYICDMWFCVKIHISTPTHIFAQTFKSWKNLLLGMFKLNQNDFFNPRSYMNLIKKKAFCFLHGIYKEKQIWKNYRNTWKLLDNFFVTNFAQQIILGELLPFCQLNITRTITKTTKLFTLVDFKKSNLFS